MAVRSEFPWTYFQKLVKAFGQTDIVMELSSVYTALHSEAQKLESENFMLKHDNERLKAENNFMIRLINERENKL